jgi:hypothetical protein
LFEHIADIDKVLVAECVVVEFNDEMEKELVDLLRMEDVLLEVDFDDVEVFLQHDD